MRSETPIRWLWVLVAALAVAPVRAQNKPVGDPGNMGPPVSAFPNDAQAPGPASSRVADPSKDPTGSPPGALKPAVTERGLKSQGTHNRNSNKSLEYDVSQIGNRPIGKGVNFYSLEKEQELGRELASELEMQVRLVDDAVVSDYVNRVGQNLVRNSDAQVPFTIKVVDDDEINAFALPGGYFYVNSGLILAADNEAELAGVMAHEIAHVACRHATRAMTKARIWDMASIPLIFVGGGTGYAIRQLVAVGFPMSSLKFGRDAEREADLLGLEYQYAAGYDPSEFVQFFEKIHAMERQGKQSFVSKLFATHPMTEDRIERAQQEIATMLPAREEYTLTTSEFDDVKMRLAGNQLSLHRTRGDRPTLRRRTSSQDDEQDAKSEGTNADDQPPILEREPN